MRMLIKISFALAILSPGSVFGQGPVFFKDQKLKACVENKLQMLDPTSADMLQLTGLRCRGSHITSVRGLQHAKNIRNLTLSFNDIESISSLSGLSNLEDLTLNDNQITSIRAVGALYELFALDVHNNQIKSVSALSGMPNLRLVTLRGNQITDISDLEYLSLTVLELEENQISQISVLSTIESLLLLNLSDNDISSIAPLTSLTELQSVDLRGNDLNDQAYSQHLQTILDNNPDVSISYDPRPSPSVQVQASKGTFSDRVRVIWSRVNNGPLYTSFYRVYRAASVSGPKTAVSAWQRDNAFEDMGVNAGTEYRYWISVAVNEFGENAKMDEASATGWASRTGGAPNTGGASQPFLLLSSTAGGEVNSDYDASSARLGDIVDITAEPVDATLFVFRIWSGTAVDEGKVLDPTDPFVRLELSETLSLKAHFLTTLTTLHVSPDVPASVEPDLPQALGTPLQPFHRIQDAIDVAGQGVTIVVEQGIYAENLRFQGINVVLTGIDYPVLRDSDGTPLASFVSGEEADCVFNGFLLTGGNSDLASALFCENSHPTVSNCLMVGNRAAIAEGPGSVVYLVNSHMTLVNCTIADNISGSLGAGITLVDSDATVTNSIIWNNGPDDLRLEGTSSPRISHSNISVEPTLLDPAQAGPGNLSVDPRFVRPGQWADPPDPGPVWTAGDYHLRSQSGRWDSDAAIWVLDNETSPSIDGGNPAWPVGAEPMPNGKRMNMGAYGGTVEASKSVASSPTGSAGGEEPVSFADENLKGCVENKLQTLDPTPSDMLDLTGLNCKHSQITSLRGLEYATNVDTLILSFNKIESISPLADLVNLTSLTINDNQISSISALGEMDLRDLDVHNNQIKSVSALSGMTNLFDLVLYGNRISSISALSDLENLEWLNLRDNNISSISSLTSLTQLLGVDLRGNDLNNQAYDQHLQTILDNNPGVSLRYDPRP